MTSNNQRRHVKRLVESLDRSKKNRLYYEKYWNISDIRKAGIVQDEAKASFDRVQLDRDKNELVTYCGFDQAGSYFYLKLTIVSLYPNLDACCSTTATTADYSTTDDWRLGRVEFVYYDKSNSCKYSYTAEELLDYRAKREAALDSPYHEARNTYRIGSILVEISAPFALARILFNGLLRREPMPASSGGSVANHTSDATAPTSGSSGDPAAPAAEPYQRLVSAKLTISTHPTCDKFDYTYLFGRSHFEDVIQQSLGAGGSGGGGGGKSGAKSGAKRAQAAGESPNSADSLARLLLDDRIDQPMMFEGHLELRPRGREPSSSASSSSSFIMWGAKMHKCLEALAPAPASAGPERRRRRRHQQLTDEPKRDCLFVWVESGQQIHLTRPTGLRQLNLINGMVHNSFDYASPIDSISLVRQEAGAHERQVPFSELESFDEITASHKISLSAFQAKKRCLLEFSEVASPLGGRLGPIRAKVNGFDGWALRLVEDLGHQVRQAQAKLWLFRLDQQHSTTHSSLASQLAHERLLGGKGNSLMELMELTSRGALASGVGIKAAGAPHRVRVSVPRGLIVSCRAYSLWLASHPRILESIRELDRLRRSLAARSIHLNAMSSEHMPLARSQQLLREKCRRTCSELQSFPLPGALRKLLQLELVGMFGEQNLRDPSDEEEDEDDHTRGGQDTSDLGGPAKLFAVRSSAVGEDSLETSAAGQMRTVLGARGLSSICRAIVECWASQFELEAVTYKSQNGLEFNLPMAVVVQELVRCATAGVAATCDPLTGDPTRLEITANRGLGEGVVSGRQTDTVRVALPATRELDGGEAAAPAGFASRLSSPADLDCIEKLAGPSGCCLSDEQIVGLANVLLQLRQAGRRDQTAGEREVEWGLTYSTTSSPPFSSSSLSGSSGSSSSSESDAAAAADAAADKTNTTTSSFHIHLLQSRPLTSLRRLSAREIDHELDSGISSPLDVVTRANLGEVMPGFMAPLYATYFQQVTSSHTPHKPYEPGHSRKLYVADSFAFHSHMATMVVTYGETLTRFATLDAENRAIAEAAVYSMIGSTNERPRDPQVVDKYERLKAEKVSPLAPRSPRSLWLVLALDLGLFGVLRARLERQLSAVKLTEDLVGLGALIGAFEAAAGEPPAEVEQADDQAAAAAGLVGDGTNSLDGTSGVELPSNAASSKDSQTKKTKQQQRVDLSDEFLAGQIQVLFKRLLRDTQIMADAWKLHIKATVMSMMFNITCMKLLVELPGCYPTKEITSSELLNDFSILMRGPSSPASDQRTESGDISMLLNRLLESFLDEGQLERAKAMDQHQLYEYLSEPQSRMPSSQLFKTFMERNGHRAYKEFCLSTRTWSDDSSYIIRLLHTRLRTFGREKLELERRRKRDADQEHDRRLAQAEAKVAGSRFLVSYALPRARNATVRREGTKSLLIRVIHKYRLAFRHLGGLLCLAGRLPSAELVYYLTIEELAALVATLPAAAATATTPTSPPDAIDVSRLLYKARRRQQRARVIDKVKFPKPTIAFDEMVATIREQVDEGAGAGTAPTSDESQQAAAGPAEAPAVQQQAVVSGLTSCGGRVTGRACVVSSLEEMDQIQPNDILVTYSIDISWSVYFFALAGIVTEVGGIVSHGAVVAREYGIPTLCTAVGACSKFKTGQLITLDADRGTCYLAAAAAATAAQAPEAQNSSALDN